ncbi:U-scoloptoxin(19)-Tl1a-like [Penaeus japonicus]|uniref:U-scoloptoxin(19)-Tl1a-like n=1 Tax=Penaeus japonicus TaxID=27405 RepID=UPI001C71600A|nr:U-scoloptoxin(19)-Tl1a-like [Penaeus japonicus]XP_042867844.1 U-scoloptoxin(19)-Tl1a-like [Penaeus japonicus]
MTTTIITTTILLSLVLAAAFSLPADDYNAVSFNRRSANGAQIFLPEDPCSREGGLCGLASACPEGLRHPTLGLCPEQQSQGAECCYGVGSNVSDCRGRGGECVEDAQCGRAPREEEGECPAGQVCCVFLF